NQPSDATTSLRGSTGAVCACAAPALETRKKIAAASRIAPSLIWNARARNKQAQVVSGFSRTSCRSSGRARLQSRKTREPASLSALTAFLYPNLDSLRDVVSGFSRTKIVARRASQRPAQRQELRSARRRTRCSRQH